MCHLLKQCLFPCHSSASLCVCVRVWKLLLPTAITDWFGTSPLSWCASSSDSFSSELHCCPVTSSPCQNLCISFVSWQMRVGMIGGKKSIHMIKVMKPFTVVSDLFVDDTCEKSQLFNYSVMSTIVLCI